MPRVSSCTYNIPVSCCHRVHLTDRWSLHLTHALFTLTGSARHEINILWNQVYVKAILVQSKCCHPVLMSCCCRSVLLNNYSSSNFSFVRQGDTPSSSLCHVQSRCLSGTQIGCLSNTESFDEWPCLCMVLDLRNNPVGLLESREM